MLAALDGRCQGENADTQFSSNHLGKIGNHLDKQHLYLKIQANPSKKSVRDFLESTDFAFTRPGRMI